jgi:hypothetical protein
MNINDQFGKRFAVGKLFRIALAAVVLSVLSACGGGGGSAGSSGSTGGGSGTAVSTAPILSLSMLDVNGASTSSLSGGDTATLSAKFATAQGVPIVGAVVSVTGDVNLVQLTPAIGSALTDVNGIALMKIKPASFTADGALTLSAQAVNGTVTGAGFLNIRVGAATLTLGNLSFTPTPTNPLLAFSTVIVNIPVTSNGTPVTSISGLGLTSLCVGDGKATLVQGAATAPGQFTATYTNKGCTRVTDQISVSLGNSTPKNISLDVSPANIGTIKFIGTDSAGSALVLKGSGGLGRKESALVTFMLVDQNNKGLSNVTVNFSATTTIGGLTVLPASATTDVNGNVSTTVSSGTIPTPVKVQATATRNGNTINGLSDNLTISTGLPIQKSMSLSVDRANIEGWSYDGEIANLTARFADQYGNPVSDGTFVNFVTEGGAVASSAQGGCSTVNGACTVQFISQADRPLNGRVTVLAYAQGLEDFVDMNGDGQYTAGEPFTDLGDPFLDAGTLAPTSGVTSSGTLDGQYDPANNDKPFPYKSTYNSNGDGSWGLNYIRRSVELIFSGSHAKLIRQFCNAGVCSDWVSGNGDPTVIQGIAGAGCSSQQLVFRLTDVNNNPLPINTSVGAGSVDKLTLKTFFPDKIVSTNQVGGTIHSVLVTPEATCAKGSVSVAVMTPKGNGIAFTFNSN